MKTHHPILKEIEAYLAVTGMGESYFGKRAVGNSELVARLKAGGAVHFRTEDGIRAFIKDNPPTDASLQKATGSVGSCPSKDVGTARADCKGTV